MFFKTKCITRAEYDKAMLLEAERTASGASTPEKRERLHTIVLAHSELLGRTLFGPR